MGGHNWIQELAKSVFAWVCTAVGWVTNDITLSRAALITSIVYSVVNVWVVLERRAKRDEED